MDKTNDIGDFFPAWDKLTESERDVVLKTAVRRRALKGTMLHSGSADCVGLFVIRFGLLRAYILSEDGREITLYRLFENDICLFSASCIMKNINFDVYIEAERDSDIYVIPAGVYKNLMESSVAVANYTNQIMAARFSDVMWLVDQIMWKSFDKRLSAFLLKESGVEKSNLLKITHEEISNHMGTAREVVTRMLQYFQSEGMVELKRGSINITDKKRLESLAG